MSGYLLDTNIVSELRKRRRANAGLSAWFHRQDDDHLYLSVLVLGEIRMGIERLRLRDMESAKALDIWLSRLGRQFAARILPVDDRVAEIWGRLNIPDPLPPIDGLLAATALAYDLHLVTRNIKDVQRSGACVINPFT